MRICMVYILGISGPTNAGKTYFSRKLRKYCDKNNISYSTISTDDFYIDLSDIPMSERIEKNYDHPNAISKDDFKIALDMLRSGREIKIYKYSFHEHVRTKEFRIVKPAQLLIVEGIFSFSFEEVLKTFDLKIYVDLDTDLRLIRRIYRDAEERGRTLELTINQYLHTIKPTQEKFVKRDKKLADVILHGDKNHSNVIELIGSHLKLLQKSSE